MSAQARLRNDVLREAASTDQRLLVAREAARGDHREGVPDGDMEDDFEPVAGGLCQDVILRSSQREGIAASVYCEPSLNGKVADEGFEF